MEPSIGWWAELRDGERRRTDAWWKEGADVNWGMRGVETFTNLGASAKSVNVLTSRSDNRWLSSHSSFIFCTSFLLPKCILCPDLKPFYTKRLFSPEKFCLKICKNQRQKTTQINSFSLMWTLGGQNIHADIDFFRGSLMFVSRLDEKKTSMSL